MEAKEIKAIFCQSFGRRGNNPGLSNIALAESVIRICGDFDQPPALIIQKDCADAFPNYFKIDKVISKHDKPGKYLDSYEVSRQCAEYCRKNGIKNLLIFSHPHHAWRVRKVTEKFGLNCLTVTVKIPYDRKSVQLWTRSAWLFIPREILVIIAYWLTGKI